MNIFVTDVDPKISAIALDDLRLRKMILESVQILSTVVNSRGINTQYKPTHVNHPCTKWVNQSRTNFVWLCEHTQALSDEYIRRFGKTHKSSLLLQELKSHKNLVPEIGYVPFVNATKFKETQDTILAYRLALIDKWKKDKRPPKWTNSQPPSWYK